MRKLVLVTMTLVGLIPLGAGCSSGDDDDDTGGIILSVDFTCPPDADSLSFTATPAGSSTSLAPDNVDCSATGADIPFDAGDYDLVVKPQGASGEFLELTDTFGGNDGDTVVLDAFNFPQDQGYFLMTWTIDGSDPAASNVCTDIGSGGVSLVSTLVGPDTATDDVFDCADGQGITSELDLGPYTVSISVLDENDAVLGQAEPFNTDLTFGDELNDLGNAAIVIE